MVIYVVSKYFYWHIFSMNAPILMKILPFEEDIPEEDLCTILKLHTEEGRIYRQTLTVLLYKEHGT